MRDLEGNGDGREMKTRPRNQHPRCLPEVLEAGIPLGLALLL